MAKIANVEELEEKIQDGWRPYTSQNKWFLSNPPEQPLYVPVAIVKALPAIFVKKEKEETPVEEKEEKKTQPKTVLRGAVPPLRVLDQSYAEALSFYGEKLAWYGQAVTEIGQVAMMMLFQIAKINVDDAYLKMEDFKDADEFVSYSTKYLVALFQAKDEAVKIVALEEDLEKVRMKLYMALQAINSLKSQRDEWYTKSKMALSCLDESGLRRYAFSTTFSETETRSLPSEARKKEIELE